MSPSFFERCETEYPRTVSFVRQYIPLGWPAPKEASQEAEERDNFSIQMSSKDLEEDVLALFKKVETELMEGEKEEEVEETKPVEEVKEEKEEVVEAKEETVETEKPAMEEVDVKEEEAVPVQKSEEIHPEPPFEQPKESVETEKPEESEEPEEPEEPEEQAQPIEPTPSEPVEPVESVESVESVEPSVPSEPSEPIESTEPTEPTGPSDPSDPSVSVDEAIISMIEQTVATRFHALASQLQAQTDAAHLDELRSQIDSLQSQLQQSAIEEGLRLAQLLQEQRAEFDLAVLFPVLSHR